MGRTQQDNKRTAGVGSSRTGSTSASQHKFGYGYEQQQQQQQPAQQLGDFFTAMSLKVPQRYGKCGTQHGYARSISGDRHADRPAKVGIQDLVGAGRPAMVAQPTCLLPPAMQTNHPI
jgi:hypothetical protein